MNAVANNQLVRLDVSLIPQQAIGLEDNCISEWAEVCKLGCFVNLQRLHLGGNQITEISYPAQVPGESRSSIQSSHC